MSARSDLAALIAPAAPGTWEIIDHPTSLRTFDDPDKPVAIVIEQRSITSSRYSPDSDTALDVEVELRLWVVVDGSRGDELGEIEDQLEAAVEQMVLILEPLPEHVWNGTAERDSYDDQKPAYSFTISAPGDLTAPTPEE